MKNILNSLGLLVVFSYFTLTTGAATLSPEILIEIGDQYAFKNIKSKVWIENPKIFSATLQGQTALIKPLQIGKSTLRIDDQIYKAFAVPQGYKSTYQFWNQAVRKIAYLNLQTCENSICLKGKIKNLAEFTHIIELMTENQAYIFLKLDVHEKLKFEIETWYNKYFRNHEITPPKIVFEASPWKVSLSSKDENIKNKETVQKVGLFTEENKNKIEISDNVKVSVQFIEMRKSFIRELGISWPNAIEGRIVENSFEKIDDLRAKITAAESTGDSKTIASPNLVCRSGKEAEFWAGGEFPVRVSTSPRNHEVTWKKFGIQLKIKPLIDPLGQMSVEVITEVSMPSAAFSVDNIPSVTTNKVASHFDLVKKRTIVLSGLIESNLANSKQGLPFLTQIPLLGPLFSSQKFLENQTELVVLVTPELYE